MKHYLAVSTLIMGGLVLNSACSNSLAGQDEEKTVAADNGDRKMSEKSKEYWYDGTAEITSFKLTQARYGELREGTAVHIFVTEPYSRKTNAKAEQSRPDNVQVLKLNATRNFVTGIYPYSLMTSTFFPMEDGMKSVKTAFSMQEWCGMMYSEMVNKSGTPVFSLHSYFEGESFESTSVSTDYLEDDIWSLIRLNPEELPTGKIKIIPGSAYVRMKHISLRSYEAQAERIENKNGTVSYILDYPELKRNITISYEASFPYAIVGWKESYPDGGKLLTSTAKRIKQIKSPYWNKSSNNDRVLREELGLE